MSEAITTEIIVLGAGAAGMICAWEAARRGRRVIVIDHARTPGEKIRISGGGRCNFTNLHCGPKNFLSANPHFAISALKACTPEDFISLVDRHGIAWHEKTLGQLFCDGSARQIVDMLTGGLAQGGVELRLSTTVESVCQSADGFVVATSGGTIHATRLVVATGGKSIPKMGATGLGYDIARHFGHAVTETRPALVPFTWPDHLAGDWAELAGVGLTVRAEAGGARFEEAMLFTHRGVSGPAMLQVSSYWREGEAVRIDLAPETDLAERLSAERKARPKAQPGSVLAEILPKRLAQRLVARLDLKDARLADLSNAALSTITSQFKDFSFLPGGTEGYRTAEVTLGGVDTAGLSQKTMESRRAPGLYFIGEVVDVTGHLGGHNFQWAWASGVAAGRHA